jgi:hypothetical protein
MEHSRIETGGTRRTGALLPAAGRAQFGQASASAMSMKWSALHEAAGAVAALAGIGREAIPPQVRQFPVLMRDAAGLRREAAEQGVEDLTAIMEPGLAALLAARARGANAAAAARALWDEFVAARDALLELSPPGGALGPNRRA